MIELKQATKRYGAFEAVKNLSFVAPEGQIIGLLGQNGAGKTTTLNMLTGYFPPTSGQVLVNGMDMLHKPRECKRMIGYLPERPPLYDEMTVPAYLTFVCRLREVQEKAIRAHVNDIIDTCGLRDVAERRLGSLSKGYRQRVGIAQALCGDPRVLVLDEPTVGLDPRQVVEIRDLMRELGRHHTIIFSSHILPEIQQLCHRVVILHRGQLVHEADMLELSDAHSTLRLRAAIALNRQKLVPALKALACVQQVNVLPSSDAMLTQVELVCSANQNDQGNPQTQLFRLLAELDAPIHMLMPVRDTLEDVFLRATAEDPTEGGDA